VVFASQVPGAAPLRLTRIAHASALIDFDGEVVLTDPWFTESSQYHHGEPLAMDVAHLPKLAAVVVSHGHYDHFDIDAFAAYPDKSVPFFVPPDCVDAAREAGFTHVQAMQPWEVAKVGDLTVTAAPAEHGVPENTYLLQAKGRTVYFGGDTLKIPALDELPKRFPHIDAAFLPVNGLRAFGSQQVMTADEAAALTAELHPRVVVPIHYAFRGGWFSELFLSYDGPHDANAFVAAAHTRAPGSQVRVLAPGQTLEMLDADPTKPSDR
jgi:L-ascorbate metabolism protein UlaG (beta-lactamase superfamily)